MKSVDNSSKSRHAQALKEHDQNVENSNAKKKNHAQKASHDDYSRKSERSASESKSQAADILPTNTEAEDTSTASKKTGGVAVPVVATQRTIEVSNDAELKAALSSAKTGDNIKLAGGTYKGPITLSGKSGVTVSGSKDAIVKTDESLKKPSFSVTNCSDCTVTGLTITGGQKGLMVKGSQNNVFDSLDVSHTAMEGVHFKENSSGNTIQNSEVHHTGMGGDTPAGNNRTQAMDGEGIYIGTAKSNNPDGDNSNNNKILNNNIHDTTAENIDIKEFTKGGVISGNTLDGAACGEGATANVEVKGSGYSVTGNTITHQHKNGIKNYAVKGVAESGTNNTIENNTMS